VAPGNPYLGVMLPYTPLHHLLCEAVGRPIVCTSGNVSEEPMALSTEEAIGRLGSIADQFLVHDRPIVRPVDDSVGRVGPDGFQVLRRARGFAPLPVELGVDGPAILAVGGHLKNAVALSLGRQAVLSQHIGDLDNALGVDAHRRAIDDLIAFFQVRPAAVACDLHPDYASTRWAEQLSLRWQVPLVGVGHHHAHVASCMAEHRLAGPVLGFSWDGTGYGPDGTVWGGEVLECFGHQMRRVAHLRTFPLPGGDRAVREPRRSALGLLHECLGEAARPIARRWFTAGEVDTFWTILARPGLTPRTSSMGRLFDAVAAICGLWAAVSFEGQAAMSLEFLADPACDRPYPFSIGEATPAALDWGPLLGAVLDDVAADTPTPQIAGRFHHTLAEMAVAVARRWGGRDVVLTGGCFQNALLQRLVRDRLASEGFAVHLHREVPPGDGGIALGQLVIALQRLPA
jgi:hydrogenase maturation protein HypF